MGGLDRMRTFKIFKRITFYLAVYSDDEPPLHKEKNLTLSLYTLSLSQLDRSTNPRNANAL